MGPGAASPSAVAAGPGAGDGAHTHCSRPRREGHGDAAAAVPGPLLPAARVGADEGPVLAEQAVVAVPVGRQAVRAARGPRASDERPDASFQRLFVTVAGKQRERSCTKPDRENFGKARLPRGCSGVSGFPGPSVSTEDRRAPSDVPCAPSSPSAWLRVPEASPLSPAGPPSPAPALAGVEMSSLLAPGGRQHPLCPHGAAGLDPLSLPCEPPDPSRMSLWFRVLHPISFVVTKEPPFLQFMSSGLLNFFKKMTASGSFRP